MIKNKKFVDLSNGKVFEVIDHFEDIAILDNKSKVKVNKLLDKNYYDEYIDPNSFFRNDRLVTAFTEKIRQLPLDESPKKQKFDELLNESVSVQGSINSPFDPSFSESAVLPYDPEEEKRHLMEKARQMFRNDPNTTNIEKLQNFIEEEDVIPTTNSFTQERPVETTEYVQPQRVEHPVQQSQVSQMQSVDPIISMFRNVKRNTDFSLTFAIKHKIPRLDFIEMMEDSYNTSLIDFLAEEFTNSILLSPELIKNKISEEIRKLVYERNQDTQEESPKTRKNKPKDD